MPSLFAGTEPPAWIERLTQRNEKLFGDIGTTLGLNLGSALDVATGKKDDEGKPLSFDAAYQERRQTLADPQWKLKAEGLKANVLAQSARAQADFIALKEHNAEQVAWLQDSPKVIPWLTATPDKRAAMDRPTPASKTGLSMMEKQNQLDEQLSLRKQTQQNQQSWRDAQLDNQKWKSEHGAAWLKNNEEWEDALFQSSLDTQATVESLAKRGTGRNKDGSLSATAKQYIAEDLKRQNRPIPGQHVVKEQPLSQEVKAQMDDLRADESDYRRQIDARLKADPDADVSELESKLEDAKAQRRALASGKSVVERSTTKATPASALDKELTRITHEANALFAQGKEKEAKAKLEEANVAKKTWVLDRKGVILKRDMTDAEKFKQVSKLPKGAWYYDEVSGNMTQRTVDAESPTPSKPGATAAPQTATQFPASKNIVAGATGSESRQSVLLKRISEVKSEIENLGEITPGNKARKYLDLKDQLKRLEDEEKKSQFRLLSLEK